MKESEALGARLRHLRIEKELGLREAAVKAGITHGYLSQIESGKVKAPAPRILQKLAEAYGEPFDLLMQWAGYLQPDASGLSANQKRALKIVGEPTANELKAIRAVLDAIRSGGTAGAGSTFWFELPASGTSAPPGVTKPRNRPPRRRASGRSSTSRTIPPTSASRKASPSESA